MSGRIPKRFIDELLNKLDIVDVISSYVPLKKAGKNYQACCPFHSEKTPSFTVNQPKQFYYCFGCGASGSVISFLMAHQRMEFVEAIESLAALISMPVVYEQVGRGQKGSAHHSETSSRLYALLEKVVKFYVSQLRKHPKANSATHYLQGRSVNAAMTAEFELGFAPPGWDNLVKHFGSKDAATLSALVQVGALAKRASGGYYDAFRNRLIFPIRDGRGRVIGLGGRTLADSANEAKYLNSKESPIFHKGSELYGLYQLRKSTNQIADIYIVEGYMDVIALAQYGINNVVASLGTAATETQIKKLFRLTDKIVFCFDGDAAGHKAAWRGLENALPLLHSGKQVYFMSLPAGEDPDSFIRKHDTAAFVASAQQTPLSTFLFDQLKANINLQTPEGRYAMVDKALPYLKKLPPSPYQDLLIGELAKIADYPEQKLIANLAAPKPKPATNKPKSPPQSISKERWLIRALLHQPSLANALDSLTELEGIPHQAVQFLCTLIKLIKQHPDITLAGILEQFRNTKFAAPLQRLATDVGIVGEPDIITEAAFCDAIASIIRAHKTSLNSFKSKHSPSDLTAEEKARYGALQK